MKTPPVLPYPFVKGILDFIDKDTYFVHLVYEYNGESISEVVERHSPKVHTMRGTCAVFPAPLLSEIKIPCRKVYQKEGGYCVDGEEAIYSTEIMSRYHALLYEYTDKEFQQLDLSLVKEIVEQSVSQAEGKKVYHGLGDLSQKLHDSKNKTVVFTNR